MGEAGTGGLLRHRKEQMPFAPADMLLPFLDASEILISFKKKIYFYYFKLCVIVCDGCVDVSVHAH